MLKIHTKKSVNQLQKGLIKRAPVSPEEFLSIKFGGVGKDEKIKSITKLKGGALIVRCSKTETKEQG